MSNDTEMRRKMAEIGGRYLARTVTEIVDLQRMVGQLASGGGNATLKEIELLAHRIRGSGAVFGFVKLSDAAGTIEMLAVDSMLTNRNAVQDARLVEQLTAHLQQLIAATSSASSAAAAQHS